MVRLGARGPLCPSLPLEAHKEVRLVYDGGDAYLCAVFCQCDERVDRYVAKPSLRIRFTLDSQAPNEIQNFKACGCLIADRYTGRHISPITARGPFVELYFLSGEKGGQNLAIEYFFSVHRIGPDGKFFLGSSTLCFYPKLSPSLCEIPWFCNFPLAEHLGHGSRFSHFDKEKASKYLHLEDFSYSGQEFSNALDRFRFGVKTEEGFGAGGADQDPAPIF